MKKSKKIKLITSLASIATVSTVVPMVATSCATSGVTTNDDNNELSSNPSNSTDIHEFLWVKRYQFNTKDHNKIIAQIKQDNQVVFSQHANLINSVVFEIETPEESSDILVVIRAKDTQSQYYGGVGWNAEYVEPAPGPTPTPSGIIKTTYQALYSKYTNGTLVVGQKYRITDYVTTTNGFINDQEDMCDVASHYFDLIVTADTTHSFSEDAIAVASERDEEGYFENTDFNRWSIKYCFDNYQAQKYYEWATSDGRGCIYYMKDEFGNEAPYDFKNIVFNASLLTPNISQGMVETSLEWVYTFQSKEEKAVDTSMRGDKLSVRNNVITPYMYPEVGKYGINAITIVGEFAYNNTFEDCASITIYDCSKLNPSYYNTFKESGLITIVGGCVYNTFDQESYLMALWNSWSGSKFSNCWMIADPQLSSENKEEITRSGNTFNGCGIVWIGANYWYLNTVISTYGSTRIDKTSKQVVPVWVILNKDRTGSTFIEGVEQPQSVKLIQYEDLLSLANNSDLVVGQQYRIIDYRTTVNNAEGSKYENIAQVSPNQGDFDIVVTANTTSTFYEDATVVEHVLYDSTNASNTGVPDYGKWKIKYDINNNVDKYDWAVDTLDGEGLHYGKGVIYYMKDEFGNECPYDFKNIQFNIGDEEESSYKYTFDKKSGFEEEPEDASLEGTSHDNIILPYHETEGTLSLNRIVFNGDYCYNNTFGNECATMTFYLGSAQNNTFGTGCIKNEFGQNLSGNRFGNNFMGNYIGNSFQNNEFGNDCVSNTFINKTEATYYQNNVFGANTSNITVGINDRNPVIFSNNIMYNTSDYTFDYNVENAFIFNKTAITPEHNFHGASIGKWDITPKANVTSTTTLSLKDWFADATGIVWTIASQSAGLNAKVVDKTLTIQPQNAASELTYNLKLSAAFNNVEVATLELTITVAAA